MKSVNINLRVEPELKALAEASAYQDGRSVSNYIVRLIRTDAARRAKELGS